LTFRKILFKIPFGKKIFLVFPQWEKVQMKKINVISFILFAGRLQTSGFGSAKQVADNASESGHAQNRRVELVRQ
jgi:hypothetical protein